MKIAILTQPLGHNYGGIMQAWAIQQVLKKMGHQPVTIDRQADKRSLAYIGARTIYRALRSSFGTGRDPVITKKGFSNITRHTRNFISSNIIMSQRIDSTDGLRKHFIDEKYEAVIVGSDQTWRPAYSPNIFNFFLDFLPNERINKIAYSSSFGVDDWEFSKKETELCRVLVKSFNSISVRETSGVKLCLDKLGVDAQVTLDPTLLLESEDYKSLIDKYKKNTTNGGLYWYLLDKSESKINIVQRVSEELNLISFNSQAEASLKEWVNFRNRNIECYTMPHVDEWLSGFERAEFVVTDSFHGMVFSILFEKPFLVIANEKRGLSRFTSLMNLIGISQNIFYQNCNLEKWINDYRSNPIDYSSVNSKLLELRKSSKNFLINSLAAP